MDENLHTTPMDHGAQTHTQPEVDWDQVAANYARYVDPVSVQLSKPALRLAPVGPSTTVLDVAAGPGTLALQAARDAGRVLAVDMTPAFVRIIDERARHAGLRNITAEVMDGQDLSIGDDAFDRAYSMLGLMMFDDRARGFRELHRVLTPGGLAAVSAFHAPPFQPFAPLKEAIGETLPELANIPPPPGAELADPARLKAEMTRGGFENVRVETIAHTVEWPTADDHWHALTSANPIFAPLVTRLDNEHKERLRAALARRVTEGPGHFGPARQLVKIHYAVGTKEAA